MNRRALIGLAAVTILGAAIYVSWASYNLRVKNENNIISASGTIEATEVNVSAQTGGLVEKVFVAEGDRVEKDEVILKLDGVLLQDKVSQARASGDAARANLSKVRSGATAKEIRVAQVTADNAQITLHAAEQKLDEVKTSTSQDLVAAQTTVDNAKATRDWAFAEREEALEDWQDKVKKYEHPIYHLPNYTPSQETEVNTAKDKADAAYTTFLTAEETYKAALEANRVANLKAQSATKAAQDQVDLAGGQHQLALAQLALKKMAPRKQDVEIAQSQVDQAEIALKTAQEQASYVIVRSPIAGTVLTLSSNAGEVVAAGVPLVVVGDIDEVKLVIYIREDELGKVKLNQRVRVKVDSYPNRIFPGRVSLVASEAEFTPSTVQTKEERITTVYAVKITLSNKGRILKPGMPADAEIETK